MAEVNFLTSKIKYGFTLAEVLITLVIVGVIAALTISPLIVKHQKQETVVRLKKAYSELCGAVRLAELNKGDSTTNWNFNLDGTDFFNTYLRPYIATAQPTSLTEYQQQANVKYLNGTDCTAESWCLESPSNGTNYNAVLANGTIMIVEAWHSETSVVKVVIFDLNGLKKPNKIGRDIFAFIIQSDANQVVAMGAHKGHAATNGGENFTRENILGNLNQSCNKNQKGEYCAGLIMIDSWQIKDDYPW